MTEYTPGAGFAYELRDFTDVFGRIVEGIRGEWTFTPDGDGCVVRWTWEFKPKRGTRVLLAGVVVPLFRRYMQRVMAASVALAEREALAAALTCAAGAPAAPANSRRRPSGLSGDPVTLRGACIGERDGMVDRIADIWGTRTAFARGERWPVRVDLKLADGRDGGGGRPLGHLRVRALQQRLRARDRREGRRDGRASAAAPPTS